jgi:hypothetical protein
MFKKIFTEGMIQMMGIFKICGQVPEIGHPMKVWKGAF